MRLNRLPLHRTLTFRLFVCISLMLGVALGVNAWHNAQTVRSMLLLGIQEKTMQNARRTATAADAVVDSWVSQLVVITNGLSGAPRERYQEIIQGFAASNPDFLSVELLMQKNAKATGPMTPLASANVALPSDPRLMGRPADLVAQRSAAAARTWLKAETQRSPKASILFGNLTPSVGLPLAVLALPFPIKDSNERIWAVMSLWQTKLYGALSSGGQEQVLLLDDKGRVVSASNIHKLAQRGKSYASHPLLKSRRPGSGSLGFKQWDTPTGTVLGAFAVLPHLGLTTLTESDATPAFEAVERILTRSALWALALLLVAVLLSYVFASGLTQNLRSLMLTTTQIAGGQFKARVRIQSSDEIGLLGQAVNHMGGQIEGLMMQRLEMARLETELQTAKMVQETFFPKQLLNDENFRLTSFFSPASECGGDWWGHYRLSPNHELVCIADATGHGVPAALVTAMVFAATSIMSRRFAEGQQTVYSPAELLRELNRTLCETTSAKLTMTFFAVVFDLSTGLMHYCNAGHNFPLIIRKGSEEKPHSFRNSNDPIGIDPNSTYNDGEPMLMEAGDRIVLFTDGLIECTSVNAEPWGKRRFNKALRTHAELPLHDFRDGLVGEAYSHFGIQPPNDDVTVVITEISDEWVAPVQPVNQEAV